MMTPENIARARAELVNETGNYLEHLRQLAGELIDAGAHAVGGRVLVLDRVLHSHYNEIVCDIAALLPPPAAAPARQPRLPRGTARAPKGLGEHRHKYNERGVCGLLVNGALCGAERQRKPKGAAAEAPASAVLPRVGLPRDYRAPVPAAVDDEGEDVYSRGTMGGSSTSERR